jgi:hypothetical protein
MECLPEEYSPIRRGRKRDAMALNDGIDAARMPILISMADQYIAPLMAQVGSSDVSISGMKVIRTIEETQALVGRSVDAFNTSTNMDAQEA